MTDSYHPILYCKDSQKSMSFVCFRTSKHVNRLKSTNNPYPPNLKGHEVHFAAVYGHPPTNRKSGERYAVRIKLR